MNIFSYFFQNTKKRKKVYLKIFFFCLYGNCSNNSWLKPEKIKDPEILDIYDIPVNNRKIATKYTESREAVKSEFNPGMTVAMTPNADLHKSPGISESSRKDKNINDDDKTSSRKKEKKSPVFYRGNELLREKMVFAKTGREEPVTIIRGSSRVSHDKMDMQSYEIKILGQDNDYAIANYPVVIHDYGSNTVLRSGYGEFTRDTNKAYFKKSPVVVHDDMKTKERSTMSADEMERYFSTGTTKAYGHVVMANEQGTAYAAKATYTDEDNRVVLEGNPRIYEKKNIYIADKMTLYKEKKIAILEGNVQVFFTEENKDSQGQEIVTIITSDYAEYRYGGEVKEADFQTKGENSFVYVSRKDSDTYSKRLIAHGEGLKEMEMFEKIYILDKENRTRLYGEYGTYSKPDQRIKVFTRMNSHGEIIHPVAYYFDKNDFLKGRITGEIFDRDLDKKVTFARGNIDFFLYERTENPYDSPSVQSEALSEWAQMEDQKKEVHLLGHPYIKKEKRKIYASEIVIYPDDNRLELNNSIEGLM